MSGSYPPIKIIGRFSIDERFNMPKRTNRQRNQKLDRHSTLTRMLLLLSENCSAYQSKQIFLRAASSDCVSQRDFLVAEKANFQVSISGDSQTIASSTEMFRHRGDEADLTLESWNVVSFRCIVGPIGKRCEVGESLERENFFVPKALKSFCLTIPRESSQACL